MPENFVINPNSVVPSQVRADVETHLQSLPDAAQWSLFFNSTTGQTVVDIISGLATYFNYNNAVGRREIYSHFAKNRSSVIGGAQRNGYSAFRGSNTRLKLTVTPSSSGIWPKYHVLGTVKDRDLIVASETVFNVGVSVDVEVIIGELKEQELISSTDRLNSFRFSMPNVSEDIRMYIDDVEVVTSDLVLDLLDGYFVTLSNPLGSVDAMYLNSINFTTKYVIGSRIKLEWIDLKNITFVDSEIQIDENEGDLTAIEYLELFTPIEDISSIPVNAQVANETGKVVKAREDQAKILPSLDTTIIDASGKDYSAAVMELFYLRKNLILFDDAEKVDLVNAFEKFRPFGIAEPIISDPIRIPIKFDIILVLANSEGNPISDVKEITQPYANKLGVSIDLYTLEAAIEALSNIKIARIEYTGDTWIANTQYEFGTIVKSVAASDFVYQLTEILYMSGGVEPTWPIVENDTVVDNGVKWIAIEQAPDSESDWAADTHYRIEDIVKPTTPNGFIYKVDAILNYSSSAEPVWTPLAGKQPSELEGTLVSDKNIIWIARLLEGTPSDWSADTAYKKGDLVVATDPGGSDVIGLMFQAYAYNGESNNVEPAWPIIEGNIITDNNVVWQAVSAKRTLYEVDKSAYVTINESFVIS